MHLYSELIKAEYFQMHLIQQCGWFVFLRSFGLTQHWFLRCGSTTFNIRPSLENSNVYTLMWIEIITRIVHQFIQLSLVVFPSETSLLVRPLYHFLLKKKKKLFLIYYENIFEIWLSKSVLILNIIYPQYRSYDIKSRNWEIKVKIMYFFVSFNIICQNSTFHFINMIW